MADFWTALLVGLPSGIAGAVLALFALPMKWTDAMLKHRFDKLLERSKAELAAETAAGVEKIRERLGHLSDRGKRSNEREYEAVTLVWEKFVECFDHAYAAVVQFVQSPDLNNFSEQEIASFLSTRGFSEAQAQQVSSAKDKNRAYAQLERWKFIAKANNAIFESRDCLRKKQIFIPDEIVTSMESAMEVAHKAVVGELMKFQNPKSGLGSDTALRFLQDKDAIFAGVRDSVRKRLMRHDE